MKIVIALVVLGLIYGCTHFKAPEMGIISHSNRIPDTGVAIVATHSNSARIASINGLSYLSVPGDTGVQLDPGMHNIQLILPHHTPLGYEAMVIATAQSNQRVQLLAGHTYVPRARIENRRVAMWLQDMGEGFDRSCLNQGSDCY